MESQMCTGSLYYWLPYYYPFSHDYSIEKTALINADPKHCNLIGD